MKYFSTVISALLLVYVLMPLQLHAQFQAATFGRIKVTNETLPHIKIAGNFQGSLTSCVGKCIDDKDCKGAGLLGFDGTCSLIGDERYVIKLGTLLSGR